MFTRLLALLVVLASPVIALGQALANRVPADAMIYVGWRGSQSLGPGYQGSNLHAVLQQSNLGDVFDQFLPQVLDKIASTDRDAAEAIACFRAVGGPMWRHPSAFYFAGIQ